MGADLVSAELLVRQELSERVAVPHAQDRISEQKVSVSETSFEVNNNELPTEGQSEISQRKHGHHHHHHHHNSEESIKLARDIGTDYNFKREIVWFNAIGFLALHLCAVYGVYLMFSGEARIWTTIYSKDLVLRAIQNQWRN